jgi:hypothetical protein
MKAKLRCRPAALPSASRAASTAIVPAPQKGSSSGASGWAAPAGGQQHPRGQRLAQRRLGRRQPIAAAVQQCAGAVDAHGDLVVEQTDKEQLGWRGVVVFVAFFVELLHGRRDAQPVADGRSHALRDRVRMIEAGLVTRDAQRDGLARPQEAFPCQPPGKFAQFVEAHGAEAAETHQHAVGRAQMQVGAVDGGVGARKGHAAGFDAGGIIFRGRQQAKRVQFLCGVGRQARGGNGKEFSHDADKNRPRI